MKKIKTIGKYVLFLSIVLSIFLFQISYVQSVSTSIQLTNVFINFSNVNSYCEYSSHINITELANTPTGDQSYINNTNYKTTCLNNFPFLSYDIFHYTNSLTPTSYNANVVFGEDVKNGAGLYINNSKKFADPEYNNVLVLFKFNESYFINASSKFDTLFTYINGGAGTGQSEWLHFFNNDELVLIDPWAVPTTQELNYKVNHSFPANPNITFNAIGLFLQRVSHSSENISWLNFSMYVLLPNDIPSGTLEITPPIQYTENNSDIVTFNLSIDATDPENDTIWYGFNTKLDNINVKVPYYKKTYSALELVDPLNLVNTFDFDYNFIGSNFIYDNTCNISDTLFENVGNLQVVKTALDETDGFLTDGLLENIFPLGYMLRFDKSCIGGNKSFIQQLDSPIKDGVYETTLYGMDVGENISIYIKNGELNFLYGYKFVKYGLNNLSIYGINSTFGLNLLDEITDDTPYYHFILRRLSGNTVFDVITFTSTTANVFRSDNQSTENSNEFFGYVEIEYSEITDHVYQNGYSYAGDNIIPNFVTTIKPTEVNYSGFGKKRYILYVSDDVNKPSGYITLTEYVNIERKSLELVIDPDNQDMIDSGEILKTGINAVCTGMNFGFDPRMKFDTCTLVRSLVFIFSFFVALIIVAITSIIFPIIMVEVGIISLTLSLWVGDKFLISFSNGVLITSAIGFTIAVLLIVIKLVGGNSNG